MARSKKKADHVLQRELRRIELRQRIVNTAIAVVVLAGVIFFAYFWPSNG